MVVMLCHSSSHIQKSRWQKEPRTDKEQARLDDVDSQDPVFACLLTIQREGGHEELKVLLKELSRINLGVPSDIASQLSNSSGDEEMKSLLDSLAQMYERGEEYWTYEKGQELLEDLNKRVREATGQDTGYKKALVNRSNISGPQRQWNDETVGRSRRDIMIYDAKNGNVDRAVQVWPLTQFFLFPFITKS